MPWCFLAKSFVASLLLPPPRADLRWAGTALFNPDMVRGIGVDPELNWYKDETQVAETALLTASCGE